jgi:hypothetical protein
VSVFPSNKPESVVAYIDPRYFPERVTTVTLELRVYEDGSFHITYREVWEEEAWMCRWDRHENPHNSRDHFHQPPAAHTTDAVDMDFPADVTAVLEDALEYVDDRLGEVWERHD